MKVTFKNPEKDIFTIMEKERKSQERERDARLLSHISDSEELSSSSEENEKKKKAKSSFKLSKSKSS